MKKDHNCIDKVRDELKAANPEMGWVRVDLSTIKNMSLKNGVNKTGQRITYSYKHTKRDGTVIDKEGKSFVSHDFCPFCGQKYPS